MKFFACIFSIYILALTVLPCVDLPENHGLHQILVSQTGDDHHANDFDQCSPFCTCECCVTPFIQQNQLIKLENFTVLLNCFSDNYISIHSTELPRSVWQPPQMG